MDLRFWSSHTAWYERGDSALFNHFGKKRFTPDPTPMEVEMRTYEEDIEMTLIDEYSRKGKEKDVG